MYLEKSCDKEIQLPVLGLVVKAFRNGGQLMHSFVTFGDLINNSINLFLFKTNFSNGVGSSLEISLIDLDLKKAFSYGALGKKKPSSILWVISYLHPKSINDGARRMPMPLDLRWFPESQMLTLKLCALFIRVLILCYFLRNAENRSLRMLWLMTLICIQFSWIDWFSSRWGEPI